MLANLALVNGLTMYNFSKVAYNSASIVVVTWIQSVFMLLPLIAMPVYVLRKKLQECLKALKLRKKRKQEVEMDELPSRLVCELNATSIEESYSIME